MSFLYNGEHSIIIDGIDTWKNLHMAPKPRPYVAAPSVKESYVDVPGSNGSLDYTEVLTGGPTFGNRTGQWNFIVDEGYGMEGMDQYIPAGGDASNPFTYQSALLSFLHGRRHKIVLTDEPDYYYMGRLTIDMKLDQSDYSQVVIKYNIEPFKYPSESTGAYQWKWRELFSNTIVYGKFSVKKQKTRTILNDTGTKITATINVTSPMTLIFGLQTINLNTGDNEIELPVGGNLMTFQGNGIVTIDYARGKIL